MEPYSRIEVLGERLDVRQAQGVWVNKATSELASWSRPRGSVIEVAACSQYDGMSADDLLA